MKMILNMCSNMCAHIHTNLICKVLWRAEIHVDNEWNFPSNLQSSGIFREMQWKVSGSISPSSSVLSCSLYWGSANLKRLKMHHLTTAWAEFTVSKFSRWKLHLYQIIETVLYLHKLKKCSAKLLLVVWSAAIDRFAGLTLNDTIVLSTTWDCLLVVHSSVCHWSAWPLIPGVCDRRNQNDDLILSQAAESQDVA